MKLLRILLSMAPGIALLILAARVEATPEMTKKEKTGCITCHVKMNTKQLNKTGECYKEKKSLPDCKK